MAAGVLLGMWTASRRATLENVPSETILDFGPWLIIGTIVGARLLFLISYWDTYDGKPWQSIILDRTGFVFYGGLIGASLACILWTRKLGVPLWKFADILAPSISLGHALGRIGCYMTGCCHGTTCDLPWGVQFPVGHETHPHAVHPVQIYEAFLNFGLYLFLAWLFRRKKFDGQVFASYLMCYAIVRGTVEFFRGDYHDLYLGFLKPGQLTGIIVFTAGALLFWKAPRVIAKFIPSQVAKPEKSSR